MFHWFHRNPKPFVSVNKKQKQVCGVVVSTNKNHLQVDSTSSHFMLQEGAVFREIIIQTLCYTGGATNNHAVWLFEDTDGSLSSVFRDSLHATGYFIQLANEQSIHVGKWFHQVEDVPSAFFVSSDLYPLLLRALELHVISTYKDGKFPMPVFIVLSQAMALAAEYRIAILCHRNIRFLIKIDDFDWSTSYIPFWGDIAIKESLGNAASNITILKRGFLPVEGNLLL